MSQKSSYTIQLDCQPGFPRPGDLIQSVIAQTGLQLGDANSKLFGNWIWAIPKDQNLMYEKCKETIAMRVKALYDKGTIRYGSW